MFVFAGAREPSDNTGQHQCPRRGAIGSPRLNTGAQSSSRQSGWRRGRRLWRVPVGAGSWGCSSKPRWKGVSFRRRKGAWALKLFTLGECQGQRETVGNREGQVFGGEQRVKKDQRKETGPLPPLRDPSHGLEEDSPFSRFFKARLLLSSAPGAFWPPF